VDDLALSAYLDGRLPAAEREHIEAHLAECYDCRHAVVDSGRLLRASRQRRGVLAVGALAAAGIIALAFVPVMRGPTTETGSMRDGSATPTLVAYGPTGETPASGPLRFSWAPVAGATIYRLTLAAAGGTPVWNASATDTSVALPDSIRLTRGARYLWNVDALLGTGDTRSTGFREFMLSP
jgi:anti-sigma factor RsiW